jgi:hypothetical protein
MRYALGAFCCSMVILAARSIPAVTLASWDFHSDTQPEADGRLPNVTDPGITGTQGLTRGSGIISISTSRVFSSTNWGDDTNSFAAFTDEADAITGEDYITFALTPVPGDTASYSTLDYTIRRTSTSPNTMIWQYQEGAGSFTDIGSPVSYTGTDSNGLFQPELDLSSIGALQNETDTVTFRFVAWGEGTNIGSLGFGRSAGSSTAQNSLVLGGTAQAASLVGDFNGDGHVNAADILAMEQALTDLPDYEAAKGLTDAQLLAIGDINGDGVVNNADLQALLDLLQSGGGSTNPVPESGSWILLALALPGFTVTAFRRRFAGI